MCAIGTHFQLLRSELRYTCRSFSFNFAIYNTMNQCSYTCTHIIAFMSDLKLALILILSTALFVIFMPTSIIIHEYGHAAACIYTGGNPKIDFSELPFSGSVECDISDNLYVYWASGGLLACIVFAVPLSSKSIRNSWLVIPLVPTSVSEFGTFVFETFVHNAYITLNDIASLITTLMAGILFLVFLCRHLRNIKKCG